MTPQSETFRLAAMSAACLALIYALMIVFQSGDRRWIDGAKMWLPFLLATLPPYLLVLWRVGSSPTGSFGFGLAIACGVLSVILLAVFLVAIGSVKEMAPMNLILALFFWHVTLLTALFVFVPIQIKLVSNAYATLGTLGGGRGVPIGAGLLLVGVYAVLASGTVNGLGDNTKGEARRSAYTQTTANALLFKLYTCLWRAAGPDAVNGFPESEEAVRALGPQCWDPEIAPDGSAYGTSYDFRYFPGPRGADGLIRSFAMATKKRSARGRWTDSYYLDHHGVYRHSVEEWATAHTDRIESSKRTLVPYLLGLLDAYHEVHGVYPFRIFHASEKHRAGPHDLVIPERTIPARATQAGEGNETIIDTFDGPIVYSPVLPVRDGAASAYTVRIRGGQETIHDLRSYLVNTDGRIHGIGEDRDATPADPVTPEIEWARGAREQTRRRLVPVLAAESGSAGRRA